ncbi:MAG: hypothetical protein Q9187_005784 [Circinaria calcarea]
MAPPLAVPWPRLRGNKADEKEIRRYSAFTPTDYSDSLSRSDQVPQIQPMSPTRESFQRARLHDSVVSLTAVNEPPVVHRSLSPPVQERTSKHQRFSILRFRHASDSQLAKTAKEHAVAVVPPMPSIAPPAIITTAPTQIVDNPSQRRKSAFILPRRAKPPDTPGSLSRKSSRNFLARGSSDQLRRNTNLDSSRPSLQLSHATFNEPSRLPGIPPAYGDDLHSTLALPVTRYSESSRSDESSGDHGVFATTTTTHTVSTTTTFFRLPRRKKDKGPLFPLPPRIEPPTISPPDSTSGRPSDSPTRQSLSNFRGHGKARPSPVKSASFANATLARSSINFAAPGSSLLRSNSTVSARSGRSRSTVGHPPRLDARGRSSTMGSLRRVPDDEVPPTPTLPLSTRTSTSTSGRPSLGGLFGLSRLRQSSEPVTSRHGIAFPGTPSSSRSNQNSINLPRDAPVVVPERQEGDTPAKYLARLEEVVSRGAVVALLSKSTDEFTKNVLRSYMRRFKFFEDPLDMAVRKMLMHVELPKETQQIDRTIQSFADRYHECNPGIFMSPDETYFVAFSILILHTDVFNKNNKHKMQKPDYTKNIQGQGVAMAILECFYDNITYTPFIYVEDELDINGDRIITRKSKKGFKAAGTGTLKKAMNEPVDPYALILENKLDTLRPALDDVLTFNDPFTYLGTEVLYNVTELHRTFFRSGIIQILSSRSRPDAFKTQATITNPSEAQVGVVDMKITKVGILWRKDTKRKKARSPWQEWGAILTGSQLYFFRNASWVKSLVHQYESHHKHGRSATSVVFKPPLEQFKPDFLLSTEDVVTLVDANYRKHKNAFVFARQNQFEEIFLADNEADMNDWLAKLNYAAAFRTAGVRMRGVIGGHYDTQSSQETREADASVSTQSINSPSGEASRRSRRFDDELAQQVMLARRQILTQKIDEANEKLTVSAKELDMLLRTARHLCLLAPIQQKTREDIVLAASHLGTSIRKTRIESWRTRCHRDILALDLDEDIKLGSSNLGQVQEKVKSSITSPPLPSQSRNSTGFNRLNSRGSIGPSTQTCPRSSRPVAQPSGARLFSMDEIFRTPSKLRAQHKSQGSWELPPLGFVQPDSSTKPRYGSLSDDRVRPTSDSAVVDQTPLTAGPSTEISQLVVDLAQPAVSPEEDQHEMLVEAGLLSPESLVSESKALENANDEDKSKPPENEVNDSLSKVRHSLHRKLQNAHVPAHHRVRKGRDSSSTTGMVDDGASVHEGEGLARGTGSFTVHGKKASVVSFGSEWQNMSPEEGFKLRKQAHTDGSKLSVPSVLEDDAISVTTGMTSEARPASMRTSSTHTAKSFQPPESNSARSPESSIQVSEPEERSPPIPGAFV